MCLDVVREAAKEGSFHRPVQNIWAGCTHRDRTIVDTGRISSRVTGGMAARRLSDEWGQVGGSAK
ncbi:hypothetical protein GCM10023153_09410 [Ornithinibacter aureus]|uniref:Uncharacterized protein n=1 Tax=Ornithinibacter aureus TaxID=622664 RepID=A0ABP8JIL7_9MICO